MKNIIELIKRRIIDIEDDESLFLYTQLIRSHPHYRIICNLPDGFEYVKLSRVISDKYCKCINPEGKYFKEWFNTLQTQYNNIINGKHI